MTLLRAINHNVDRSSMAHSVEIRNPFLDYRLVQYCLALPASLKIHDGLQKYIMRKSAKHILPEKVVNRVDKMGFNSPEAIWAKGQLKDFYFDKLAKLEGISFIKADHCLKEFAGFVENKKPYNRMFWRLISFQHWLETYKVSI